jgi:hypothetical protein
MSNASQRGLLWWRSFSVKQALEGLQHYARPAGWRCPACAHAQSGKNGCPPVPPACPVGHEMEYGAEGCTKRRFWRPNCQRPGGTRPMHCSTTTTASHELTRIPLDQGAQSIHFALRTQATLHGAFGSGEAEAPTAGGSRAPVSCRLLPVAAPLTLSRKHSRPPALQRKPNAPSNHAGAAASGPAAAGRAADRLPQTVGGTAGLSAPLDPRLCQRDSRQQWGRCPALLRPCEDDYWPAGGRRRRRGGGRDGGSSTAGGSRRGAALFACWGQLLPRSQGSETPLRRPACSLTPSAVPRFPGSNGRGRGRPG